MQRIGGVPGPQSRLQVSNPNPAIRFGDVGGGGHPCVQAGHAGRRLQRILRRDQPPNLVKRQAPQSLAADMQMPGMRRVEGPAKEPNPAPAQEGAAERWDRPRQIGLRADLAAPAHNVFVAGQLLGTDRATRMQLTGRYPDLRPHAELGTVGVLG